MLDAVRSEAEIRRLYERAIGHAHDFDVFGTRPSLYPSILRDLGLGNWETVDVGPAGIVQACIDACAGGKCCILACTWSGGGGHALVCDEVHTVFGPTLCICDPWDGELRLVSGTPGTAVTYDPTYRPLSITFGGTRRAYTGGVGTFDGRIVRRV